MPDTPTLGQVAYEAYVQRLPARWLYLGHVRRPWEALAPEVQPAWEVAAQAVLEAWVSSQMQLGSPGWLAPLPPQEETP